MTTLKWSSFSAQKVVLVKKLTASFPVSTTAVTTTPAISTPMIAAFIKSLKCMSRIHAPNAPEYTPEPGKGTPMKRAKPHVPYLSTYG